MGGVLDLKIICTHGHYRFEELESGQVSKFCSLFGFSIEQSADGFFTFTDLLNAPDHSIKGADYMGLVAVKTYAGKPWNVFKENGFVYDFIDGKLKKLTDITYKLSLFDAGDYYTSSGLIMAGSFNSTGKRVTDFMGKRIWSAEKFNYSSVVIS